MAKTKPIKKILVANRGEIAIRIFRAASELGIGTVAIYTYEDRYSLHRFKADESYLIGSKDEPLRPYLDVELIIQTAKDHKVDAIHPGYGFLSENVQFATRCREEGIIFIGPSPEVMNQLGDKMSAKTVAHTVGVPTIQGSKDPITSAAKAKALAQKVGFPIMLKAAAGGGGRGMRVVKKASDFDNALQDAQRESLKAFGSDAIFIEQFIDEPRHIEVQILGDNYGNIVHLYERDCSVQRRFQKVVEVAPSAGLSQATKESLFTYATDIAKHVGYSNAGTVEFLVDKQERIFFIEVNPRIQVEHTVTEEVTGIDIVKSQIRIAEGYSLESPEVDIASQEAIQCNGVAIQCRITTENPANGFKPDYGRIISYRSPGGFGIRLDAGNAYDGVHISPFFDSMLVKITASGRSRTGTARRLSRALREFRIRGIKTNIPFLLNVISHDDFINGQATVKFIEERSELFAFDESHDTATKALHYLGNLIVNGNPDLKWVDDNKTFKQPILPSVDIRQTPASGTKQKLDRLGPEKFAQWLKKDTQLHITDTTFRDAHQSLLATRMRTHDMLEVARRYAIANPEVFSLEMWGGATFDVSMRFLHECPWERLSSMREAVPNILLQMLLRGSNAVGYTAYPDNVIAAFIEESAKQGIDIFRIFDSQNWLPNMKTSIQAVRKHTNSLAEVCMCYTGDLQDPDKTKFTLQYYLDLARKIEDAGAHILAIKDMAGLLKPYAAKTLITELKKVIDIPIHLHTHDTSSIQSATYLQAIESGVDVVDVAAASMSGLTSQPNLNAVLSMLKGQARDPKCNQESLDQFSTYWEDVREMYYPFESGLKAGTAEVYHHEIPGGQYSNLRPQARALGLDDQFETVKRNYAAANALLGNIVKVTPSSKVVGDFALFMTANHLSKQDVLDQADTLDLPASVRGFLRGELGQPYKGFPKALQKAVLKDTPPLKGKPNADLPALDLTAQFKRFKKQFPRLSEYHHFLSWCLYPEVFSQYYEHHDHYGPVTKLPTPAFFYGLKPREEVVYDIGEGKTITITFLHVEDPLPNGLRPVFFKLNGQSRVIEIPDHTVDVNTEKRRKASGAHDIGAPLQGKLYKILVKAGEAIQANQPLFVIEAMKMETTVTASHAGKVADVVLQDGVMVEQDDVVVIMEA